MAVEPANAPRTLSDLYEWLGRLTPNALQMILGVDEAGELRLCTLGDATPLRIQGLPHSRDHVVFTLLAQLCARNDPDTLRVILLDPRRYISTLFGQHAQVRLIANTQPALIHAMHLLHQELERRLPQTSVTTLPWLIFVEEDLVLYQDELTWTALQALVEHGREVGLHLLVASSTEGGLADALEALPPFPSRLTVASDDQAPAGMGFTLERDADSSTQFLRSPSFDIRLLVHLARAAHELLRDSP